MSSLTVRRVSREDIQLVKFSFFSLEFFSFFHSFAIILVS